MNRTLTNNDLDTHRQNLSSLPVLSLNLLDENMAIFERTFIAPKHNPGLTDEDTIDHLKYLWEVMEPNDVDEGFDRFERTFGSTS